MLKIFGGHQNFCDAVSRRNFLQVGALGLGGLALPQLLQAESQSGISSSHKAVIMVYLPGGASHLDMYDIKEEAPKEIRGDFDAIPTNVPGVRICEHMPKLAANFDKFVAIRSLVGQADDHSPYHVMTGRSRMSREGGQPAGSWPSLGSTLSKLQGQGRNGTPSYISLSSGVGAGFLGTAHSPFSPSGKGRSDMVLNGITLDRLEDRKALLTSFDRLRRDTDSSGVLRGVDSFNESAFGVITSSRMLEALDVSREDKKVADRYKVSGDRKLTDFMVARRLVEAGARCVTLSFGGWDTHSRNFETLKRQLPQLDQGVTALVQDLHDRGLDKDVSVVVWGEFGRTPRVNMGAGRDHWSRVMGALLAGGGMRTGQAIGATDRLGGEPGNRPVHLAEVFATLYHNVGLDVNRVTVQDLSGRPQHLVSHGHQPMRELV
jgi:hypothetical protein